MFSAGKDERSEPEWMTEDLFEEIYHEYKDAVFGFTCYLTRNRGEAEDLFQEAWLRMVSRMPERIHRDRLKYWIFTVVSNLHKDTLRKKRVRRLFIQRKKQEGFGRESQSDWPEPEGFGVEEGTEITEAISRAVAALPDKQRRVFVLKEIGEFSQAEIGEMLGIPVGTVKSLMHRAVKRLQHQLFAYQPNRERIKCGVKILSV